MLLSLIGGSSMQPSYKDSCLSEAFCPSNLQAQYVFIHDALDELITCGETDIPAAGLRVKVNHLKKTIPGSGITGFARQFKVQFVLIFLNSDDISMVFEQFSFFVSSVFFVLTC